MTKSTIISTHYTPPLGLPVMCITVRNDKLIALDWHDDKTQHLLSKLGRQAMFVPAESLGDDGCHIIKQTIDELDEYFAGSRKVFSVPLDLSYGTAFEQVVWRELLAIPYGQTISYAKLAQNIGKSTAYRACANANGKNPISLIIPCHRVIASDGGLGGYTGGTDIKKTLLDFECRKPA